LRAAVLNEVDGAFELREVADPVPQDGEALVRVRAAGINFLDILIRRGRYPQMPELPTVLGAELAGELEDGTRVMALLSAGGYAELAAVPRASSYRCRTGRASPRAPASSSPSSPRTCR